MSYGPTIFFTKLSLLLFYLRIFSIDQKARYAIHFGIFANFVFYLLTTIFLGVWYIPRPGETWLESSRAPRSRQARNIDYPQGIFGVISDLYIFFLPMPTVAKLNLPYRKKLGVAAIFAIGSL